MIETKYIIDTKGRFLFISTLLLLFILMVNIFAITVWNNERGANILKTIFSVYAVINIFTLIKQRYVIREWSIYLILIVILTIDIWIFISSKDSLFMTTGIISLFYSVLFLGVSWELKKQGYPKWKKNVVATFLAIIISMLCVIIA
ncbi:hypothetical protein CMT56_13480 [Elizabethkingia anophelis]|nr:hypothetical protein [Elizabethkingia anophelis]MDV3854925.1 hypothetical protein [Elizabethkingia anophelis]MDV3860824.1 hypothetical protein [Elizabethkingia anophelis]MDV3909272.1 hypothetical protein [Elizabethkingia anophelis]MDV3922730.1 hypothetical protein [Elizabethkingia anophelis]